MPSSASASSSPPADLAQESECTRLCEELAEERIDIFINNAGFGVCGSFLETSTEAELSMAKVNVLAMHQLCKFAVQKLQAQGFGTVLNVASIWRATTPPRPMWSA